MDKVQKTAFTDYNTPSSEPFRLHLNFIRFKQRNNAPLCNNAILTLWANTYKIFMFHSNIILGLHALALR
jgi:hypothetical protein